MKKLSCILLALVLILTALTACSNGNKRIDTTTANTTTVLEPSSEQTTEISTEQQGESPAYEFLKCLKDKDLNRILKLIGADSDDEALKEKALKAYSFLGNTDIDSYEIHPDSDNNYMVQLKIAKSSNDFFQAGTSQWILRENDDEYSSVSLFTPADRKINIITHKDEEQSIAVKFCYDFSNYLDCHSTLTDFNEIVPDVKNEDSFTEFCDGLALSLPVTISVNGEVKRKQLESLAKTVLGITDIDITKSLQYKEEDDTIQIIPRGGEWVYSSLSSENYSSKTKQYTVVIDYYSDNAYILKAKSVKYILRENIDKSFTLLSTRLLFDSGLLVLGARA